MGHKYVGRLHCFSWTQDTLVQGELICLTCSQYLKKFHLNRLKKIIIIKKSKQNKYILVQMPSNKKITDFSYLLSR